MQARLAAEAGVSASVGTIWTFLDQVLVPVLRPGDVVIMDNLSSHKRASR
jgi:hypothetical protein